MTGATIDITALLQSGFRYALSLSHDKHQAEDLLQDAWLAVMQAGGPLSRTYLFSAIRSRFLNANRREKLVLLVSMDDAAELEQGDEFELDSMPLNLNEEHLHAALADLRSVEREVLFLMVVEGYTAQEVADLTARPRGTVLSLLHRGKAKIRRYVEQRKDVMP
ncbi:MAG TPA: RNA polymerase sigma factor [Candidatus Tenderia electrophaga]|uniref:RNA polymerase sigma factor n=1 Tax=Candidatus Tenderia electrophaga TaxID=1748243 RepID=A0A832J435_9GAMM|nr:RNA polymerase sigma factor [Candidatus Tenderia electrophaga]